MVSIEHPLAQEGELPALPAEGQAVTAVRDEAVGAWVLQDADGRSIALAGGMLARMLDDATAFEGLQRKVSEQSVQLADAQARLVSEVRRAATAEIASNVLHNVGNVLTSVNVSTHVLATQVRKSPASRVGDLARLLADEAGDLEAFFGPGGRGNLVPGYLRELAEALGTEREQLLSELQRLSRSVDHIKNVVAVQQSYATGGLKEPANICDIVDDAIRMQEASLARHGVRVARDYVPVHGAALDRTRLMQILVNLLENARQAMDDCEGERLLTVTIREDAGGFLVAVRDTGCGIAAENLRHIFSHGFTTKAGGHGFGLHSCAEAAREMGGTLTVASDGPGRGASFELRLKAPPEA